MVQIVYLTTRPGVFRETLNHVRELMPFVDDVVAVVPSAKRPDMAAATSDCGFDNVTLIVDEELLPDADLATLDHSSRNYRLRVAMLEHEAVAAEFIMSDDDSRPLKELGPEVFRTPNGQARRFYFYDLRSWRGSETPFDKSQMHSLLALQQLGITRPLAFGSHMPQLIVRDLFRAAAERVASAAERYSLCEWTIYANLAATIDGAAFVAPEPFTTLAWPQYPSQWPRQVVPDQYLFENFHPELYLDNGLFAGLATAVDRETVDAITLEKVVRWHRLERSVNSLDFPSDIDNPWIKGSAVRKLAFGAAKAAKKVVDYTNLDDRSALSELTERVRLLESRLDE